MTAAGLWKPHRRKARRPHLWRPRRSRRGELVQWDTSEHDWLEGRGDEKLYLIGMIDDASSELLARFVRHDSSEENRRLLRTYVEKNGRPLAVYSDRASLFVNTPKNSVGEDPKTLPPTQIGRALQELEIESITAYSPQAKGRVERSFGTAQDRLVKGLRLAGATTIEQANAYLESEFLPWWNTTLGVTPAHSDEAHRQLGPEHNLDSALSHVEARGSPTTTRFASRESVIKSIARRLCRVCGAGRCAWRAVWTGSWWRASASTSCAAAVSNAAGVRGCRKAGRCRSDRKEGSSPSSSPQGQRLDEGLRPEEEPVALAGGAGFRHPAGPSTSRCAELAAAARPKLHGERRANGARRSSRCLSPRPQLRDFTKAIVLPNPQALPNPPAAGSGPKGKAVCKRSVRRDGRALSAMGTGICSQLPAGQSGLGGRPKIKPPAGDARGSCHSADCFGASPVASALGMEHRRDPALHNHYPTTASRATRPKPDISTWR